MGLIRGSSSRTKRRNIGLMQAKGFPRDQSVAAAHRQQRSSAGRKGGKRRS